MALYLHLKDYWLHVYNIKFRVIYKSNQVAYLSFIYVKNRREGKERVRKGQGRRRKRKRRGKSSISQVFTTYVPGTVLNAIHTLPHIIHIRPVSWSSFYFHFIAEDMKLLKGWVTWLVRG